MNSIRNHFKLLVLMMSFIPTFAHAGVEDFTFDGKRVPKVANKVYQATDGDLRVGNDGVTIIDLAQWAQEGRIAKLEDLFENYSVSLECLPVGRSAGAVARVFGQQLGSVASQVLDITAGVSWIGKRFDPPAMDIDCTLSTGVNRLLGREFVGFTTRLLPKADLAKSRGNIVDLNYAQPGRGFIAGLVKTVGVYDLMVAIPGKYGPLYVGKTWFGKYKRGTDVDSFQAKTKQTLWYFLDYNQGALNEQAGK